RKGTVALNNGGNISGATSATLTLNSVKAKDAGSDYNVVITGACATVETSNNVSLEVNAAPSISTSACVGSSASFSATATGEGLTYQWRKGTVNLTDGGNITGSNSPTLTINPVSATDASSNYNVLITGTCSTEGASLNIGLIVNTAMNITAQPTNQVACVGTAAIFTVGATGTGLSYQWKKGSVNLINGGTISGATSATLVINPVSAADVASDYHVVITGPCSSMATSTPASLSLCIPTGTSSLKAGDLNNVVTIYPNPFTSSIDVKVADASKMDNYELRIFSITGDVVLKTRLVKEITTLETSHLAPGVYSYQVNSNSKTIQSGKLISKQ
ncbi:MAG TPA: T9SS type A sorting domain-containing protein, partial [Prolixibacteraceae bacterium]